MAKLKVTENFRRNGDTYRKGETYLVSEEVAAWAEENGYGTNEGNKSEEDLPKLELSEPSDKWDRLKERAKSEEDKPPKWNPQEDSWLFGEIRRIGEGKNGRFAVVEIANAPVRAKVQLEGDKCEYEDVHPGERVLLWEVKDLESFFDRMQAGSDIAIQYRGTTETSNGRLAKVFNSAVER